MIACGINQPFKSVGSLFIVDKWSCLYSLSLAESAWLHSAKE
jgi:hypothetical protein